MQLTNEFSVAMAIDETWHLLTDLERIAPCMPGAELQAVEGDEYRGVVKVKVGPITAQYKGKATFAERDDATYCAVVVAEGRETRGQGNASATITVTLEPTDDGTRVTLWTDLSITGKVAQFGRGVMADVSTRLLDQFVKSLESDVLQARSVPTPGLGAGTAEPPGSVRKIASQPVEAVDLLGAVGPSMLKRAGPVVGLVVVVLWLRHRTARRRYRKPTAVT